MDTRSTEDNLTTDLRDQKCILMMETRSTEDNLTTGLPDQKCIFIIEIRSSEDNLIRFFSLSFPILSKNTGGGVKKPESRVGAMRAIWPIEIKSVGNMLLYPTYHRQI